MRWSVLLVAACLLTVAAPTVSAEVDPYAEEPCSGLDVGGGVTGSCDSYGCRYYYVVGIYVTHYCWP